MAQKFNFKIFSFVPSHHGRFFSPPSDVNDPVTWSFSTISAEKQKKHPKKQKPLPGSEQVSFAPFPPCFFQETVSSFGFSWNSRYHVPQSVFVLGTTASFNVFLWSSFPVPLWMGLPDPLVTFSSANLLSLAPP